MPLARWSITVATWHALLFLAASASADSATAATSRASLDGFWFSRAYGELIAIRGDRAEIYDVNPAACLKRPDPRIVDDRLFRQPRLSGNGRWLNVLSAAAMTLIRFERLPGLPAACTQAMPTAKDPLYNFDAFWSWFDQNYAFFAERGVDWTQIRATYRPQVTSATTDAALLELFRVMLRTLQDRHTFIDADGQYVNPALSPTFNGWLRDYRAEHASLDGFSDYLRQRAKAYLARARDHYLDPGSVRDIGSQLVVGSAGGGQFGYLQVLSESGFSSADDIDLEIKAAERQLDAAFIGFRGRRGLILDLRFNYGGADEIGLLLAGLIADRDRPGFAKCTRDGSGFTPLQETKVLRRPNAFSGPIVILSSTDNVSAGENFAMVARTFPNVAVIGDRSASVHSDVLEKDLPNGWTVGVSNEAFISPDGTMYETVGIIPDLLVPFAPEEVRESGVDPLLEKGLELLREPGFETARRAKRGPLGRRSPCSEKARKAGV